MSFPLMVFAAGFGTRMGALTANRPKPLILVAGKPLLGASLPEFYGAYLDELIRSAWSL